MLVVLSLICAIIPFGFALRSLMIKGAVRTFLSPFWYFTLLWYVSYPFQAVSIALDWSDRQIPVHATEGQLVASICIAFLYWMILWLGFVSVSFFAPEAAGKGTKRQSLRSIVVFALTLFLLQTFLKDTIFSSGEFRAFLSNEQNEMRTGQGAFFLGSFLFVYVAIIHLGHILTRRAQFFMNSGEKLAYAMVIALGAFMMLALNSRRMLTEVIVAVLVSYIVYRGRGGLIAASIVFGTIVLSPVLQVLRYLDVEGVLSGTATLSGQLAFLGDSRFWYTSISSSFEGASNLANFLATASQSQIWLGVDFGQSWLFNFGLSLFPRVLWSSKPEIYGSIAQQAFLYPEMYERTSATTTFPVGVIVDSMFAFGLFGALSVAFLLGRFLRACDFALWDSRIESPALKAIAVYVYVVTFNFVRAGSGNFSPLILFSGVVIMLYGIRPTLEAWRWLLGITFGKLPKVRSSVLAQPYSDQATHGDPRRVA